MTEKTKMAGATEAAFKLWFFLFGLGFVATIGYYGTITVASAHMAIAIVFVRQMSLIYHEDVKGKALRIELDEVAARMDAIDPYKKD